MKKHFIFVLLIICFYIHSEELNFTPKEEKLNFIKDISVSGYDLYGQGNRRFALALTENIGANMSIWAWDKYVVNSGFADISQETIEHNIEHGFRWDHNIFFTNQFLHPYQGMLYYSAFRTNGFSYWESVPFTLFGSVWWEYLMERNEPSLNDFYTSSMGGVVFGETSYRIANLIRDESDTGKSRVMRELGIAFINPYMGLNRALDGSAGKKAQRIKKPPYKLSFALGASLLTDNGDSYDNLHQVSRIDFVYGDPYDYSETYTPFDYFTTNTTAYVGYKEPVWEIFQYGVLHGRKLFFGDENSMLLGFFQHFDHYWGDDNKIFTNSVGVGSESFFYINHYSHITLRAHWAWILFGGADSFHTEVEQDRNYDYSYGHQSKIFLDYENEKFGSIKTRYYDYRFLEVLHGAPSTDYIGIINVELDKIIYKNLSIGISYEFYFHQADYENENYDTMTRDNKIISFLFIYKIK